MKCVYIYIYTYTQYIIYIYYDLLPPEGPLAPPAGGDVLRRATVVHAM